MQNDSSKIKIWLAFSAFVFFACSLAFPSGYSYGSVGLLLGALVGAGALVRNGINGPSKTIVALFLAMGLLWGLSFDGLLSWTDTDYLWKYWLAAFVLAVVTAHGIKPAWVLWGIGVGAVGALGIAGYQYLALGMTKAEGHTNAIQFGGISMYLGIAAWSVALFLHSNVRYSAGFWLMGACGVFASLLSETRGAWLVAPFLIALLLGILVMTGRAALVKKAVLGAVVVFIALVVPFQDKFQSRASMAIQEMQAYVQNPQHAAETSVGQRLEQWRVMGRMIAEKPITGWGVQGFIDGKKTMVASNHAHPSVMEYGHAHNEILDMWAKRGVLGLLLLGLFYAVPLYYFWPTARRLERVADGLRQQALAIRAAASLLPVAYFGFGWTQVFFAHNSGNMFYLFAIVAFWGALQYLERSSARA